MIGLILGMGLALVAVMIAGWAFQRGMNNGGWTDVFWTFGTGAAGVACALWPLQAGPPTPRQWLCAALVGVWASRLGLHIALRVSHSHEDARYASLRQQWGPAFQRNMALFLPVQAIVSIPLIASVAVAARKPGPDLGLLDVIGVLVMVAAVMGEGVADRQLDRFKAHPANRGRVCDEGLWRWSRHPNYFFEWLGWLAYLVIAFDPAGAWTWGWMALGGPLAMYLILNFATGIPPLEAHMLRSRGEAFRRYRSRTSAFFPLPPKP